MKAIFLLLLAIAPLTAGAWNQVGHRTIAELAWRQLTPDQRRTVSNLLKHHPHYSELLASDVPAGVETNEWVFLSAAVWPDWVRPAKRDQPPKPHSITKYNLYPHAIGYPFLRPGNTNHALIEKFHIAKPNAEMVLSSSIATLRDEQASLHDRAVSLCWVLHLIGDLHQPLHAANLVTEEKPHGEGLGGDFFALDPRSSKDRRVNLHAFWDGLPGSGTGYRPIASLADELSAAPDLKPSSLKDYAQNKSIASWVQESFQLAVSFAYSADHVRYARLEDIKSGKVPASAIPTLSNDYIEQGRQITHRRLMLAGQRLTDVLTESWKPAKDLPSTRVDAGQH